MSVSDSSRLVNTSDDIWHQNKAEIRNLYQDQRKTLREVKTLMELKGFPKKPLSTWETKLRDVLHLRKKAKATNWPLIYQHILPRLERPGQKQLRCRTAIYLNGSNIPWDKAWKEIKRSRAIVLPSHRRPPSPLPPGIVIRTPSPTPERLSPVVRVPQLTGASVATHSENVAQDTILRCHPGLLQTTQIAIGEDKSRSLPQYAVSVYQKCAATIPWVDLYQLLQNLFHCAHAAWRLDDHLYQEARQLSATIITNRLSAERVRNSQLNIQPCFYLLPAGHPIPPRPSHELGCRAAMSATRLQVDQFICTAMYLLSNDLHDHHDGDRGLELFCSILERDSRRTMNLLYRRLPSIRCAWAALLRYSCSRRRRTTFRLLIDIGIRNKWLISTPIDGVILNNAVEMDCCDALKDLVTYGNRSGSEWSTQSFRALITAIRNENDECARLLFEHSDVNAPAWWAGGRHKRLFEDFVYTMDIRNDRDMRALDFLLKIGANVDEPSRLNSLSYSWCCGGKIDHSLRLTILDRCFYLDHLMYEKLVPYSKVSQSETSRAGLLLALKSSKTALHDYVVARTTAKFASDRFSRDIHESSFLELVLAEQFMLQDSGPCRYGSHFAPPMVCKEIDLEAVRALVQYGVDLNLPSLDIGVQDLLDAVLQQLSRNCTDDGLELITILIAGGASLGRPQLRMAVGEHGCNALECLALLVEDFPIKAVLALAEAARLNNFEAVGFLVRAGVDPSSFVTREELGDRTLEKSSYSVQAIAVGFYQYGEHSSSRAMMQLLAEHGARLVVTPNDSSPFDFIQHILMSSHTDTFLKVEYAMQFLKECASFSSIPSSLLESCFDPLGGNRTEFEPDRRARLEIFEYFINEGASVSPGPCLAALIRAGGREKLIEAVVRSGADLNAHYPRRRSSWIQQPHRYAPLQAAAEAGNENLVRLLLEAGSHVNGRACGGFQSKTALQAICAWDTATEEEYERKLRICELLISHGAYTNGAPARISGFTALQHAAMAGHLDIAALLLQNGARVNAPSCTPDGYSALDLAAQFGRLDMVKFLLNANALSGFRGTTGYDGIINRVEDNLRGIAIADLIRKHAENNMALGLMNPELLKPDEDYHIYGYVTLEDCYDPDSVVEDCTVESLCGRCAGIAPDEELMDEENLLDGSALEVF